MVEARGNRWADWKVAAFVGAALLCTSTVAEAKSHRKAKAAIHVAKTQAKIVVVPPPVVKAEAHVTDAGKNVALRQGLIKSGNLVEVPSKYKDGSVVYIAPEAIDHMEMVCTPESGAELDKEGVQHCAEVALMRFLHPEHFLPKNAKNEATIKNILTYGQFNAIGNNGGWSGLEQIAQRTPERDKRRNWVREVVGWKSFHPIFYFKKSNLEQVKKDPCWEHSVVEGAASKSPDPAASHHDFYACPPGKHSKKKLLLQVPRNLSFVIDRDAVKKNAKNVAVLAKATLPLPAKKPKGKKHTNG